MVAIRVSIVLLVLLHYAVHVHSQGKLTCVYNIVCH